METCQQGSIAGVYTLSEFLDRTSGPVDCEDNALAMASWRNERDVNWMGLKGQIRGGESAFDCTARLVRDGYADGIKMMEAVSKNVTAPTPMSVRRVPRWAESGDDVDMQRIWNGELDTAWRTTRRDARRGPQRVRILIDSIACGGDEAESMCWRGVAALKLADLLTEAGYSVQVESVIQSKDSFSDTRYKLRTIVKEYEQPLDMLTLAATTALPAFFRSLVHTWGLVIANYRRPGVSYSVEAATVEMFVDDNDNAAAFMIGQSISNAAKASGIVTSIVQELDKASGE